MNEKTIEPAYVPETPLEELIYAGDPEGTIKYLAGLDRADLSKNRKAVLRIGKPLDKARYVSNISVTAWRGRVTDQQSRAFYIASFVCGTLDEKIESCRDFFHDETSFVALWRQFPPAEAQAFAEAMLAKSARLFRFVQELYLAGQIARPAHENYVLGLLTLPMDSDRLMNVRQCIERDPGLMHDTLLRLFEIDGVSDISLAGQETHELWRTSPRNTWGGLFLELCETGAYSRALLIDKTLGALEKDWIQFRSGWFSRFHGALAPSPSEMAPFAERYMGLCQSRIAPTVTLALAALENLFGSGVISGKDLIAALRPVLSSSVKGQVESALKLLDRAVANDASLGAEACSAAIPAFGHSAPELHKILIARLRSWGMDDSARRSARETLPYVSAANRDALAALLGVESAVAPVKKATFARTFPTAPPLSPLDESRVLVPIDSIDELVERAAYVLENPTDLDEFERVLDALLRFNPHSSEDKQRFSPVLKRARKLKPTGDFWRDQEMPVARELARLLVFLLDGERLPPTFSYAKDNFTSHALLCERIEDLMNLAVLGHSVSPLATPTHKRGFIAAPVLVERISRHMQLGTESSRHEQVLSLLRLAPTRDAGVLASARTLPETPLTLALRYALGDSIEVGGEKDLFVAAGRIRHTNEDDANLIKLFGELGPDGPQVARYVFSVKTTKSENYTFYHGHVAATPAPRVVAPNFVAIMRHPPPQEDSWNYYRPERFGGENESLILFSATILPSSLEAFFAEGVRALSNNLDWEGAQWYDKAYLALLLDRTVPFTPLAYRTLACALGGKEPGQTAMAIDALIAGWIEARLEVITLAGVLRELLQTPLFKLARYGKSLALAARAHEHAPWLVFDLLCEAIRFDTDPPPKDTSALLELLLSVALELHEPLPNSTRAAIEKMKLSGKGKAAQKELLARC